MNNKKNDQINPKKDSKCAVIIPAHKPGFSDIEKFILENNSKFLNDWDTYFASPFGITPLFNNYPTIHFDQEHFKSIDAYSDWLKTETLYDRLSKYKFTLILQTDAILCNGNLNKWINLNAHYIGAPWHNLISFNNTTIPELPKGEIKLNVGNGGLSLRNNFKFIQLLRNHQKLIDQLPYNEDVVFSLLGLIDPSFEICDYRNACSFALELNAREILNQTHELPFGFHALYKYDPNLWHELFPQSPQF